MAAVNQAQHRTDVVAMALKAVTREMSGAAWTVAGGMRPEVMVEAPGAGPPSHPCSCRAALCGAVGSLYVVDISSHQIINDTPPI